MPLVLDCEITAHQEAARDHQRMVLRAPEIAAKAAPGQFCMLEVREGFCPFLRRPMSIERIFNDGISFLYKVTGQGTRMLATLKVGANINVQGPLGNVFPMESGWKRRILVGGGIGVAPLPGLAEALVRAHGAAPEVILAARNEQMLLCEKEFAQMGCTIHLATDDGSAGMRGYAADALRALKPDESTLVYTCGPNVMMRSIHETCQEFGARCYASLEACMACGDGVCMGCVVETTHEVESRRMARVCQEGPIFDAQTINWKACTQHP